MDGISGIKDYGSIGSLYDIVNQQSASSKISHGAEIEDGKEVMGSKGQHEIDNFSPTEALDEYQEVSNSSESSDNTQSSGEINDICEIAANCGKTGNNQKVTVLRGPKRDSYNNINTKDGLAVSSKPLTLDTLGDALKTSNYVILEAEQYDDNKPGKHFRGFYANSGFLNLGSKNITPEQLVSKIEELSKNKQIKAKALLADVCCSYNFSKELKERLTKALSDCGMTYIGIDSFASRENTPVNVIQYLINNPNASYQEAFTKVGQLNTPPKSVQMGYPAPSYQIYP